MAAAPRKVIDQEDIRHLFVYPPNGDMKLWRLGAPTICGSSIPP